MPRDDVTLTGFLRCRDEADADVVRRHLPEHIRRTRAEPGCAAFAVEPTADPLIWSVAERFVDQEAFAAHQRRVAGSEWGRATAGIPREYEVRGL
ncbi:putative quinol monooxygenase [Microbacterium sp. G2-8]|uniref:putative quinol monooxygenase n=1 Tax=Microbacterium sp. G2-8 TaxID=2842454 RepID=UPI001C894A19|nr:antibiotic biosynthesis monooxygenase [Microbacterium sp. G2-8]